MKKVITSIIFLLVFYFIYKNYYAGIKVKSNIDNRYYFVRNVSKEYNQKAADTLAKLNASIDKLIKHLKSIDNGTFQKNVDLLIYRYNPNELMENIMQIDTSFTIDKGQRMELCIDTREPINLEPEIHDLNTLLYVLAHEISHCASITYNHTPEFKRNFQYILKKAIEIGIYKYIDYSKTPINYCGMKIEHNIL